MPKAPDGALRGGGILIVVYCSAQRYVPAAGAVIVAVGTTSVLFAAGVFFDVDDSVALCDEIAPHPASARNEVRPNTANRGGIASSPSLNVHGGVCVIDADKTKKLPILCDAL
jgi:hypothetical protein